MRTANRSTTPVTEVITLPVERKGEVRDIKFLIVPDLRQKFYFGIDFWQTFGLFVVSKSCDTNSTHIYDALEYSFIETVK